MRCPNCSKEVPTNKKFCGHCGQQLHVRTPDDFDEDAATIMADEQELPIPEAAAPVPENEPASPKKAENIISKAIHVQPKPKSRRNKWVWIIAGVGILAFGVFVVAVVAGGLGLFWGGSSNSSSQAISGGDTASNSPSQSSSSQSSKASPTTAPIVIQPDEVEPEPLEASGSWHFWARPWDPLYAGFWESEGEYYYFFASYGDPRCEFESTTNILIVDDAFDLYSLVALTPEGPLYFFDDITFELLDGIHPDQETIPLFRYNPADTDEIDLLDKCEYIFYTDLRAEEIYLEDTFDFWVED